MVHTKKPELTDLIIIMGMYLCVIIVGISIIFINIVQY